MRSVSRYKIHTIQFLRSIGKGERERRKVSKPYRALGFCMVTLSAGLLSKLAQSYPLGGLNSREIEELCLHGNNRANKMDRRVNTYSPWPLVLDACFICYVISGLQWEQTCNTPRCLVLDLCFRHSLSSTHSDVRYRGFVSRSFDCVCKREHRLQRQLQRHTSSHN